MKITIQKDILSEKRKFDTFFRNLLKKNLSESYLDKVMIYSALNGGKRIRPYLVKQFSIINKINPKCYKRLSSAIEIIHSYSLIHDDLPSMDNDDFRRGKLSTHKKFNEAQAILAGDSLHDLAFEILSDKTTHKDPAIRIKIINLLSKSLGSLGLAGGQSLDLLFEGKKIKINEIKKMYTMKTGALFKLCCTTPFIINDASKKELNFASEYGDIFGIIFQIVDDYLDLTGKKNNIGKTPGKDSKQMKSTFLSHYDNKNINEYCALIISKFSKKNSYFLRKWSKLEDILNYLVNQLN